MSSALTLPASKPRARVSTRSRQKSTVVDRADCGGLDQLAALSEFHVLKKIGEGGFGKVVLCRQKTSDRLYAIKALDKKRAMATNAEQVRVESASACMQSLRPPRPHSPFHSALPLPVATWQVLVESECMQSLGHPFIMRLHGAFQDAQHFFFVLEYLEGGDLFEHVREHCVFPLDWAKF